MSDLTNYERETIILYNQAEKTADVQVHDPVMKRKLRKMSESNPESVVYLRTDEHGAEYWCIPVEMISIRFKRVPTPAQLNQLREASRNSPVIGSRRA